LAAELECRLFEFMLQTSMAGIFLLCGECVPIDPSSSVRMSAILSSAKRRVSEPMKPSLPIRFGIFEADLQAGELLRQGVKVRLQQQPFQVLAALIERPGEVVTRDELQRRIWPSDTFVDFERGLNKAMNRLRDALEDSPENPRFIETLPKRGYRFIGQIERRISSIAVLAFESSSGDRAQEYWADGITGELTTQVSRISDLRVVSRGSVMRFKNTNTPLLKIAQQLGVDAVIEGSVFISEDRVRIHVELVDAFNDRLLWGENYERALDDMPILHVEIATAVAEQIRATLTPAARSALRACRKVKPEAYESYLKGRFFWNKRTEADLEKSLKYFSLGVGLDPSYAPTYAGLADSYVLLGILGLRSTREVSPKAREAADTALTLDETLAEAHYSLGTVKHFNWDWEGAEKEFRRAIELDPSCTVAHQWYAGLLLTMRRYDDAINEAKQARDLDPLSHPLNAFLGLMYMEARQYDQAIEIARNAIELDAHNPFGRLILARCLSARGDLHEAVMESEAAVTLSAGTLPYLSQLGYAYAKIGKRRKVSEILHQLEELSKTGYVSPYHFALIYTALGRNDAAFEYLEKSLEERTPRLTTELRNDPMFDVLRDDSRFAHLVLRIGYPS
jgi:TolB-like protein/tetratricopeptide (TPR) repeat protein